MYKLFLLKYGEIGVKGKNKHLFEDALAKQVRLALRKVDGDFFVSREEGRIYVEARSDYDYDETLDALKKVFGIVWICPMVQTEDNGFEELAKEIVEYVDKVYPDKKFTFKVESRRARKNYPMNSMELNAAIGEKLLAAYEDQGLSVDVHKPDVLLNVEVRAKINIYSEQIKGVGGMPVGTNGKALLLLSGGIDSPVAGYLMAKRGVTLDAIYYHTPPFTSDRAKQKVVDLAKLVSAYSGPIRLHVVNFTDVQMRIYDKCPHDELTIIMKRYMIRIAEAVAAKTECIGLATGESIGQVSSQTMQSLAVINEAATMPVMRPLICFDKQEIIDLAEKIGTYETSIEPYEDCCTTFVAKHPVTKPTLKSIVKSESHLGEDMEELVAKAIATVEDILID